MSNSPTRICNIALSWIGAKGLSSLDDDESIQAQLCRANYDFSRRAVLEEREWTFAIMRARLLPTADEPVFGFGYQYIVPGDSQRLIQVYDGTGQELTHVKEGNFIYTDQAGEIFVKYVSDSTDSNIWSDLFIQALAAHLASVLAMPLTDDAALQQQMYLLYEDKLNRAAASDGLQGSREFLERSQMENARRHYVPIS